jgi:hypothetical protein
MATIKTKGGKVLLKDDKITCSCCGCSLEPIGGSCELEFIYVNTNAVQDDAFDIELLKSDGTWVKAGNINGACESYSSPPCICSKVDTKKFKFTIDQSFVSGKAECAIEFRSIMTQDNGCGTFGTFDIIGPNGTGFGGYLGGSGLIDITVACFPPV